MHIDFVAAAGAGGPGRGEISKSKLDGRVCVMEAGATGAKALRPCCYVRRFNLAVAEDLARSTTSFSRMAAADYRRAYVNASFSFAARRSRRHPSRYTVATPSGELHFPANFPNFPRDLEGSEACGESVKQVARMRST